MKHVILQILYLSRKLQLPFMLRNIHVSYVLYNSYISVYVGIINKIYKMIFLDSSQENLVLLKVSEDVEAQYETIRKKSHQIKGK